LGIKSVVLPMTDDDAPTIVDTLEYGRLPFQEYFVRYRWQPTVRGLDYGGTGAQPTQDVLAAIRRADVILIAPSNPWLSIAPLLALPGVRAALMSRNVPRIAITPIIGGKAVKGPLAKIMAELNFEVSARAVAEHYGEIINGFVYDERDMSAPLPRIPHLMLDTLMTSDDHRARLARQTLDWIASAESV
jgi:LPPG:FO 2-phospho-L-lactate transferase